MLISISSPNISDILRLHHACDLDRAAPMLEHILVRQDGENLVAVATDGRVLAERTITAWAYARYEDTDLVDSGAVAEELERGILISRDVAKAGLAAIKKVKNPGISYDTVNKALHVTVDGSPVTVPSYAMRTLTSDAYPPYESALPHAPSEPCLFALNAGLINRACEAMGWPIKQTRRTAAQALVFVPHGEGRGIALQRVCDYTPGSAPFYGARPYRVLVMPFNVPK